MRARTETPMERLYRQSVDYCEFAMQNWCRNDSDGAARKRWEQARNDAQCKLDAVRAEQGFTGVAR